MLSTSCTTSPRRSLSAVERCEKGRADLPHGESDWRPAAVTTVSTPCSPRWTKPAWRKCSSPSPRCGRMAQVDVHGHPSRRSRAVHQHVIPTASSGSPATTRFASKSPRGNRLAVKEHGFKGVYVHIYGFDIPLHDSKMYPLYAKCDELKIPVSLQVGHVLEAMPSEHARPIYLDRIASDFPDSKSSAPTRGGPGWRS